MVDEAKEPKEGRRVILRRSRGSRFAGGSRPRQDGQPRDFHEDEDYGDEVDEAIDPEAVERHVRQRASEPLESEGMGLQDTATPRTPAQRMHDVALSGSATFSREYRLTLLHRLLLRRIPLDQIARQLGVSISTVEKDRAALKRQLRESARDLNIDEMIGNQTGLYDEIGGMALQIASQGSGEDRQPTAMRLAAMRTALAANADKTRFYQSAGVFDVLRFRRAETGGAMSDVQELMERTRNLISQLRDDGGFEGFDLSDEDDPEVLEL